MCIPIKILALNLGLLLHVTLEEIGSITQRLWTVMVFLFDGNLTLNMSRCSFSVTTETSVNNQFSFHRKADSAITVCLQMTRSVTLFLFSFNEPHQIVISRQDMIIKHALVPRAVLSKILCQHTQDF